MKRKHDDTRSTVLSADHNASVYDQCMDNTIYPSPDPIYDETYVPRNGGQYSGAVVRWVYISMYLLGVSIFASLLEGTSIGTITGLIQAPVIFMLGRWVMLNG